MTTWPHWLFKLSFISVISRRASSMSCKAKAKCLVVLRCYHSFTTKLTKLWNVFLGLTRSWGLGVLEALLCRQAAVWSLVGSGAKPHCCPPHPHRQAGSQDAKRMPRKVEMNASVTTRPGLFWMAASNSRGHKRWEGLSQEGLTPSQCICLPGPTSIQVDSQSTGVAAARDSVCSAGPVGGAPKLLIFRL